MCAIFGTIGTVKLDLIKEISEKQIFRGPDEQNFYVSKDNLVCLGNNRLSVIDKENGHQPMVSFDKRYVAVFNGCIYNFNEIKKHLLSKGIKFLTNSDTEVVCNAYAFFGEKAFNYFDGMWGIAIYDQEKKQIVLSRDYVGQKPLYYTKNDNYYIFSSQLNGITYDNNTNKKLSKDNLKRYFTYSFVHAPYTLYENIYQVEPGENIFINSENLNIDKKKYWDFKNGPDYNIFFNKTSSQDFLNEFKSIISEHTIADKTPTLSLSSGLDSYVIMNYYKEIKDNILSFTLGFENKTYDESIHVKKIINNIDKKIYYTNDEDLTSNFIKLSKNLTEPTGDSSLLPSFIIHNKIKNYSNVTLGGDGGDESFFGYITFDAFYLAAKLKKVLPNLFFYPIKKLVNLLPISYNYIAFTTKVRKFFNSINLKTNYLLPSWTSSLSTNELGELFNEKYTDQDIYSDVDNLFSDKVDIMRSAQLYYFKFYLPMVLSKVDQASMLNSVESRSPFLSKKIINFSLNQEIKDLYKFFKKKYFIKKLFRKIIPDRVLKIKKHGFAFPKEKILKNKNLINKIIDKRFLTNEKFFNKKYDNFNKNKEDCSQYLWNELILNITLQNIDY